MKEKKDNIEVYAYKLLKKKNYFIKDFYNRLVNKYSISEVNKIIKKFILLELINDKYLTEMKMCYFIHIKMYGRKYIMNYFQNNNISVNLVKYLLSRYDDSIFIKNIKEIECNLRFKGKKPIYVYNYLLRKGYTEEELEFIKNTIINN